MRPRLQRTVAWDAAPQQLLELIFSVGLMGVVIAAILPIAQRLLDSARLVEPLLVARDLSYHLAIDHAFSGRWRAPDEFELPASVTDLAVSAQGHVQLSISNDYAGNAGLIHWRHVSNNSAYGFISWHCDGHAHPLPLDPRQNRHPPLQRVDTRYICQ